MKIKLQKYKNGFKPIQITLESEEELHEFKVILDFDFGDFAHQIGDEIDKVLYPHLAREKEKK